MKKSCGSGVGSNSLVVIVNPLNSALHHYVTELTMVLNGAGVETSLHSTDEPSANGRSAMAWLVRYLTLLVSARFRARAAAGSQIIVLWPVLGYFDLFLVRSLAGPRSHLIMHDPRPLVKSVGYGRFSRWICRSVPIRANLLTHSERADLDVAEDFGITSTTRLPHPCVRPIEVEKALYSVENNRQKTVRVFGQYKPDRDLTALVQIAETLAERFSLEISGRGWPDVPGWSVQSKFLEEDELDNLISDSFIVVIPYKRFYQSGIAIRCLERGVPFVGPRVGALGDLVGISSKLLVDDDWGGAITAAAKSERAEFRGLAIGYFESTCASWLAWYTTVTRDTHGARCAESDRHKESL